MFRSLTLPVLYRLKPLTPSKDFWRNVLGCRNGDQGPRKKKRRPASGPPRFLSDIEFCLEPDADAELEGARDARRERAGAKSVAVESIQRSGIVDRTDRAVQDAVHRVPRRIEVGDVEEIEYLHHRLDAHPLLETEGLRDADIGVDKRVHPFHKMMTNTTPFYRDRFC